MGNGCHGYIFFLATSGGRAHHLCHRLTTELEGNICMYLCYNIGITAIPKPTHSLETVVFKVYALLNNKHRYPQNEVPNSFSGSSCSPLRTPARAGAVCLISRQRILPVHSSPCAKGLQLKKTDICRESPSFQAMCPASLNALSSSASSRQSNAGTHINIPSSNYPSPGTFQHATPSCCPKHTYKMLHSQVEPKCLPN